MKSAFILGAVAVISTGAYLFWPMPDQSTEAQPMASVADGALVQIVLPETLLGNAKVGKVAFDAKCSACHGSNAVGKHGVAPPLVHKIYEPNHHGDESFQRAAAQGVRAHHWPFGDMPPVQGITRGDVKMIIAYIRELQRTNGIN